MRNLQSALLVACVTAQSISEYDEYTPMLTSRKGSLKTCRLDNMQVLCTCDKGNAVPMEIPLAPVTKVPKTNAVYVLPMTNDSGSGNLYNQIKEFMIPMVAQQRNDAPYSYRLVHKTNRYISYDDYAQRSPGYKPCTFEEQGYSVTEVPANIIADLKVNDDSSFHTFFSEYVPDVTTICDGNAYYAMYEDMKGQDDINAVQLTIQPFPDSRTSRMMSGNTYDFPITPESDFIKECNKVNKFVDSVMILTDAKYRGDRWVDALGNKGKGKSFAWSELFKCTISQAQDAPNRLKSADGNCEDYFVRGAYERKITNLEKRKTCPMIPNFGKSTESNAMPRQIADLFTETFDDVMNDEPTAVPYLPPLAPQYEPAFVPPQGRMTIPEPVKCNYDVIVALDLDCIDYNENPVIGSFARVLVRDIFNEIRRSRRSVEDGAVRVGIIGFHAEIEIGMNLFQMSSTAGLQSAEQDALKAIRKLQSFALSRRNFKNAGFRQTFKSLATFFDSRENKVRELIIVTNAIPGPLYRGDWSAADLTALQLIKDTWYKGINIRAVPVNKACSFAGRQYRYFEDCSYSSALSIIDSYYSFPNDGTGSGNGDSGRPGDDGQNPSPISTDVLCPSIPCPTYSQNWRATYYQQLLDRMRYDLDRMEYDMYCEAPKIPPQPCGCTARGKLQCCFGLTEPGFPGPPGPSGARGPTGMAGLMSRHGKSGPTGTVGATGTPGPRGIAGKNAPPPPKGPDGPPGDAGTAGVPGEQGLPGNSGNIGHPGAIGSPGETGLRGDPGSRGSQGEAGVHGEPGACGPVGNVGADGGVGMNQIFAELSAENNALLANMAKRISVFLDNNDNKKTIHSLGERFIGLGNGGTGDDFGNYGAGNSFCSCETCQFDEMNCPCFGSTTPPTTPPPTEPPMAPESTCVDCVSTSASNMVFIADNSKSVTTDPSLLDSLNSISPNFMKQWYDGNRDAASRALFGRFSNRLQIDAKIMKTEDNDLVYIDHAKRANLADRHMRVDDGCPRKNMSIDEAHNRLAAEMGKKNEWEEPISVQEETWGWNGDELNLGARKQRVKNNAGSGSTFFYSMLSDLVQFLRGNGFTQGGQADTELFILTDAIYFHDDVYEWKKDDFAVCQNQVQDQPVEYDVELSAAVVCNLMLELNDNFKSIHFWPTDKDMYDILKCKLNNQMAIHLRNNCPEVLASLRPTLFEFPENKDDADVEMLASYLDSPVVGHSILDQLCCSSTTFDVVANGVSYVLSKIFNDSMCPNGSKFNSVDGKVSLYYSDGDWVLRYAPYGFYVYNHSPVQECCPKDDRGTFISTDDFSVQCATIIPYSP